MPRLGTVSSLLGYIVLCTAIPAIAFSGGLRKLNRTHLLISVYTFWCMTSYFWAIDQEATTIEIWTLIRLVVLAWLVWEFAQEEKAQIQVMKAYLLGCCVTIVVLLQAAMEGKRVTIHEGIGIRYRALGMNEDDLALLLVISIPISLYLGSIAHRRRKYSMWLFWVYAISAGLGVVLTGARGGFLAMVGGLFFWGFTQARFSVKKWLVLGVLIAIVALVSYYIVPESILERLGGTITELRTGDWSERKFIFQRGLDMFIVKPVVGSGFGCFISLVKRAAHNTFLAILVETGLVGLVLFLCILASIVTGVRRLGKGQRYLWLTVLLMWCLGSLSIGWENAKATWLIFGLVMAHSASSVKSERDKREAVMRPCHEGRTSRSFQS